MGRWCVSFCRSIMNNWAPPWYPIPQHEYSGGGGVSWECWEPPLYPVVDHTRAFCLTSLFLLISFNVHSGMRLKPVASGDGAYRSDAWLSITALRRGWIDWLYYCGFVWVFNWLINCGPRLRCDWLWVVSSGLELGLSKPTGWEVSSCGFCNMLVLLSKNPTFIPDVWYSHTVSLPWSPLRSSFSP